MEDEDLSPPRSARKADARATRRQAAAGDADSDLEPPRPPSKGAAAGDKRPHGGVSSSIGRAGSGGASAMEPQQRKASRSQEVPGFGPDDLLELGGKGGGKGKGKGKGKGEAEDLGPKEEPNFEASGLLALEDNAKNGVPLKFTCPAEARRPTIKWRLYVFTKQSEAPKIIQIHRGLGYLFGKDRRVVDVPTDHATCSKQHAVLHHRLTVKGEIKPYIMDLESKNGTFLNGNRLEPARYYEMKERDVLKFGMSSREFVLLHAGSANDMPIDPAQLRVDSD